MIATNADSSMSEKVGEGFEGCCSLQSSIHVQVFYILSFLGKEPSLVSVPRLL